MIKKHTKTRVAILTVILALCCLSNVFLLHNNSYAIMCGGVETTLIECEGGGDAGIYHILALTLDILTMGVGILGVIGISIVGIQYLTAGGSVEKTTKAKRRLYEIVIGIACYAVLWGATRWLLPSGSLSPIREYSSTGGITVSYTGVARAGVTFTPSVVFEGEDGNETYSLISTDKKIAITLGRSVKCIDEGTVTIKAISASGKVATMDINCEPRLKIDNGATTGRISSDGGATVGNMSNTKFNGKQHLRVQTQKIIDSHNKDFYYYNYNSAIKKYGGYNKYVQSLGGIFARYASNVDSKGNIKKISVKTAADLQAAAEYTFGLWMIWGPDYGNGRNHHDWATSDAFYKGQPGRGGQRSYATGNINKILKSSAKVRTNCNVAIEVFRDTTDLPSVYGKTISISKVSQLQVGDIIQMWRGSVYHMVMVGEVYKDYIVTYDGGSRFMRSGSYKQKIPRTNNRSLGGTYSSYKTWKVRRPWKINQNITLQGLN